MYKFLMRHKKPKLGQKAIFKAGGPSNKPTGGSKTPEGPKNSPEKTEHSKKLQQLVNTLSYSNNENSKKAKLRMTDKLIKDINELHPKNDSLHKNTKELRTLIERYINTGANGFKELVDNKTSQITTQLDQLAIIKEGKEVTYKLTRDRIEKFKNKVKQSHIKFSKRESKEYDHSIYRGGTVVEVSKTENLRDENTFKAIRKAKKGENLILTGDYKILEFEENKTERVYWETVDQNGKLYYVLGESINPLKEKDVDNKTLSKLHTELANSKEKGQPNPNAPLDPARKTPEPTPEVGTAHTPKKAPAATPEIGTAHTPEKMDETPKQKMDRLKGALTSYKETQLRNKNLENPNYLKDILKNDQLSDLQRNKIENSMNDLGISFGQLSTIISENGNKLPLDTLIKAVPLNTESEMAELRKEFLLSTDAQKLKVEITQLKKSKSPEDKIKLSQKLEEFRSKQEAYAKEGYANFMDYYQKSPSYKSVLKGYIQKTEKLSADKSEDSQIEFEARYKKLQRIYELASTLQTLDVRESTLVTRDNIEDIDTSKAIPLIKKHARTNASRLGLNNERIANLEKNLESEAFGAEERNLYLTALLQLSTNKNIDELRRSAVIQGSKNKLSLSLENLNQLQKDKLILGLAHSESISKGFLDNVFDTDNLTETLHTLQNSKSFSQAKKIMYYHELKSISDTQRGYTHLNQIFDRNYTGNLSKANDRYYTKTMEDSIGGTNIEVESTNVIRRFSSDLSQYQNILQEVEVNGVIDPNKLQTKFNQLIKLGVLGIKFDEKLPKAEKLHLERLAKGELQVTAEDFKTGLTSAQISLIRYGTVYEQLRNEFLKSSPKSPNRLIEKAGFSETDPQATYSALSTALQYIENGNLAVGGDGTIAKWGEGWTLKGGASVGVYVLENPKVSTGASLTIKKETKEGNKFYLSAGTGFGVGPDTVNTGANLEIGVSTKINETMTVEYAAGGGLIIGGVNVYIRGGLKENNILKDKNQRMASGLEKVAEKKLSKEEIKYLKTLASKPNLTKEDIAKAAPYFPGLEEALKVDPKLRSLPIEQLEVFKSNYIQTILTQLNNMTTEQAEGVNWNAAIAVGVLFPFGPTVAIPYIIPMAGLEWGGNTKVMKLYDSKNQLTEAQLKQQLRESLKSMPTGTNLQIISESGYAANINGKEVVVKGANETIQNLEISNPIDKLNALRSNTGIEFSKMNGPFLRAKIDDFQKLRQGLDAPNATKVNLYIDPALEKTFKLGHMDGLGEFGIKMLDGQIPDNLVILRESITTPSTSGGSTTEVKISFTTRENLLTGSEIENSSSLFDYISLNKYGRPEVNRDENNLSFNRLKINESLSFNRNFTKAESQLLAEYSDSLIARSSIELQKNTHTPTEKLDKLIDKLLDKEEILKKLATLTVNRIEKGKRITPKDREAAFKLIESEAKAAGFTSLEASDYIYIYGNLLPDTFRPINKLAPKDRVEAINKIATQYVEDYVRAFTKNTLKPNGERFTEEETQIIIKNLSKHSAVKDSFKASLLTSEVTLEGAGGSQNKLGLNGYELFTTAHRRNVKGLRNSEITQVFENKIVKGSLTKFDTNTIKNEKERNIVNQFLHSMSEQVPAVDTNDFTMENLKDPEFKEKIKQVLNSRTALQLMSTTPFSSEGKKVSLLGAMYGPEALMHIENFYNRMDKLGSTPTGLLVHEGPMKEAISALIKDIQKIDRAQGKVKLETFKGDPLEINIKEESGVVLIGKCANPTYIYQRKLSSKLDVRSTTPAAAKANASRLYKLGKATRENMSRIGFATKLSATPKPPEPKVPSKEDNPGTPETPPEKVPSKTDETSRGVSTDPQGNTRDAANDSPF